MEQKSVFDDAEAKRIIARAAEIDAQRPLDAKALRDIAAEAGISPASVDKALEEHLRPPPSTSKRLRRPALVIGAAIGWSAAILLALAVLGRLLIS